MAAAAAEEPPTQASFTVSVKVADATSPETVTALSVELQSPFEPAQSASDTVEAQAGQSVAFDHTFQLTAVANAALEQGLLGAPMRVSIFDRSGGGKVLLSTADVDLVSFAAGATTLEVSCPLAPATPEVEAKLLPGASAAVSVALVSPACLVSPEDVEGGAVVTVTVEGVTPPPTVFTAAPAADQYIFTVGVAIGSRHVLLSGGHSAVGATALSWPAGKAQKRIFLRASEVAEVKQALRAGASFSAQIARYLKPEVTGNHDPNYAIYLNSAVTDLSALGKPGATEAAVDCGFKPLDADEAKMLPPPAEGGKPLPENPAPGPDSPWRVAGSRLKFQVVLSTPLFPAWAPPKRPDRLVGDFIPARPAPPPAAAPTPEAVYEQECKEVVAMLADRYSKLVTSGKVDPAATPPDELRKEVVFTLTRSGEYLEMKQRLAAAVGAVAAARGAGGASPEERNRLYADVYADLLDLMHKSVGELHADPSPRTEASSAETGMSDRARHLLALAEEYEAAGDVPAAERCHQERIVVEGGAPGADAGAAASTSGSGSFLAAAFADYGLFLQRTARPGAGQEALKEALSLEKGNASALLGLAAGLLEGGAADLAEPFAYELTTAAAADLPAGWFVAGEVYAAQEKETDAFNARFRLSELLAGDAGKALGVAEALLAAGAPSLALRACDAAAAAAAESVAGRVLSARAHEALKDPAAALEATAAALAADRAAAAALEAAGCAYVAQGSLGKAEEAFLEALSHGGGEAGASLRALLLLAWCQQNRGAHDTAAGILLGVGRARRSTAAWAAAARSLLSLGDHQQAEEAAAEANVLDPSHAAPWGLLALAATGQGRAAEAATALHQALELGFADARVVADVGAALSRAGQLAEAERVLKRALDLEQSAATAMALADALVRAGKMDDARKLYQAVIEDELATEEERLTARHRAEMLPPAGV